MVRVFRFQQFGKQDVFSSQGEPVALACSEEWLFIATVKRVVEVHQLQNDGDCTTVSHRFDTVSTVVSLAHSPRFDCIAALEKQQKRKSVVMSARLYFNWRLGQPGRPARALLAGGADGIPVLIGGSSDPTANLPSMNAPAPRLSVVELPYPGSPSCVSCCPRTGSLAIGGDSKVRLFVLRQQPRQSPTYSFAAPSAGHSSAASNSSGGSPAMIRIYTVEHLLDIDIGMTALRVDLCEGYLAVMSTSAVRVLHIDFNDAVTVTPVHPCLQRKALVEDEDNGSLAVWDGEASLVDRSSKLELASVCNESGSRHEAERPQEVLGPVRTVWGQPVDLLAPSGVPAAMSISSRRLGRHAPAPVQWQGDVVTMLYRQFSLADVGEGLHSLQLLPIYENANSYETTGSCWMVGMYCLVSGPREGFIYSVSVASPASLLSKYNYVSETYSVSATNNFLQAITPSGLETYTMRIFSATSEAVRTALSRQQGRQPGLTTDRASVVDSARDRRDRRPTLDEYCPPASLSICVFGMTPFYGLCSLNTQDSCVVLLSKVQEQEKEREDPVTRNFSMFRQSRRDVDADCSGWSVYVLYPASSPDLYQHLSLMAKLHKISSPNYEQLLSESFLLLRSRLLALAVNQARDEDVSECEEEKQLCRFLHENMAMFGDYWSRPDSDCPEKAVSYYRLAQLSIEDVVERAKTQAAELQKESEGSEPYGLGTVLMLSELLGNTDRRVLERFPEALSNDIVEIYTKAGGDMLADLVLESGLQNYSDEVAVNSFHVRAKRLGGVIRLSARDAFALCVLHLRLTNVDAARLVLERISRAELVTLCSNKHQLLLVGEQLSHVAQLIRQHRSDVLVEVLVRLHDAGHVTVPAVLKALGMDGDGSNLVNNSHARLFLENILSDDSRRHSYDKAAGLACRIYWERFQQHVAQRQTVANPRSISGGHFASRFTWLNSLPPFDRGSVLTCAVHRHHTESAPPPSTSGQRHISSPLTLNILRSTSTSSVSSSAGQAHSTSCNCAYIDLVHLQSLLSWRAVSPQLASGFLKELQSQEAPQPLPTVGVDQADGGDRDVPFTGWLSLQALCCVRLDRPMQAAELLIERYPSTAVLLAQQHFGADPTKWQYLVQSLLSLASRPGTTGGSVTADDYMKACKALLSFVAEVLQPSQLLRILPSNGAAHTFLPYVESCYLHAAARQLADGMAQQLVS